MNVKTKTLLVSILLFASSIAFAASFQSLEESAATLGNANAGTTVTDSPSIQFYNPGGMVFTSSPEIGASLTWEQTKIDYTLRNRFDATIINNITFKQEPLQGNTAGAGTTAEIPAFYFIYPINHDFAVGFGTTVPFGLETEYNNTSLARFFATKSQIETVNLNPSVAIKITPYLGVGLGLDIQYAKTELDQIANIQILVPIAPNNPLIKNEADDWATGWDAGIYLIVNPTTKIGFAYHSQINHHLKGTSKLVGIDSATRSTLATNGIQDNNLSTNLILPDYATISISHKLKPWWTIMADLSWVHWGLLKSVTLTFTNPSAAKTTPPDTITFNYHDTFRVSVGQSFELTPQFLIRTGIAYDQTPVPDAYRTARLPDNNRLWVAAGGRITLSKQCDIDFGYAHIFVKPTSVRQAAFTPTHLLLNTFKADYSNNANLFGLQFNYHFA